MVKTKTAQKTTYICGIWSLRVNIVRENTDQKKLQICTLFKQRKASRWKLGNFWEKYRSSPPQVFLGKSIWIICSKFKGKHPSRSVISMNVQSLKGHNLIKKILQHRCFPVNIEKFLSTAFSKEYLR